jgi:hypothetical protein
LSWKQRDASPSFSIHYFDGKRLTQVGSGSLAGPRLAWAALLADAAKAQYTPPFTPFKVVTVDEVRTMLQRVDGHFSRATKNIADPLPALTNAFVSDAWTTLELESTEHAAQLALLRNSAVELASAVVSDIRTPGAGLTRLQGRSLHMNELWFAGLVSLGVAKKKTELSQAIRDGRWADAIDIVKGEIVAHGTTLGDDSQRAQSPKETQEVLDLGSTRSLSPAGPGTASVYRPPLAGTARERQDLFKQGEAIAFAQSVLFAVLFVVGVYLLYADNWVGTGKEMLTLLMLGFGIDLTGDSVLALFKKLRLPEL